jgi:hypothetical protein
MGMTGDSSRRCDRAKTCNCRSTHALRGWFDPSRFGRPLRGLTLRKGVSEDRPDHVVRPTFSVFNLVLVEKPGDFERALALVDHFAPGSVLRGFGSG